MPAPVNDTCATAKVIGSLPYTDAGLDTTAATTDAGLPSGDGYDTSVAFGAWYEYTPAANQTVRFRSTGYDTVMQVYTGACGSLATISGGYGDDSKEVASNGSQVILELTGGTTYRILVGSYDGVGGSLTVTAEEYLGPFYRGRSAASQGGPLTPGVPQFPDTPNAGDLVFVVLCHYEASYATANTAGFTALEQITINGFKAELWQRTAVANEYGTVGPTYSFSLPRTGNIAAIAQAFWVGGFGGRTPHVVRSARGNASGVKGTTSITPADANAVVISAQCLHNTSTFVVSMSGWNTGAPGSLSLTEQNNQISANESKETEIGFATVGQISGATGDSSLTMGTGDNVAFLLAISTSAPATPVMPEPGSQVDNSTPCCDSHAGGSATGPVTPPVTSFWYRRCTGGGVVPTAADVAEPEDWHDEFPPKEADGWLTIVGQAGSPTDEADERWGLKPLSDRNRFVAGRLEEVGSIERRSSDKNGYYAPARMRVVAQDDDGTFRERLGDPTRRDLVHREARFEVSSYAARKAGLDPIPRIQGRIVDVQPGLDRKAIIEIQDIVGSQFGPLDPQKTIGLEVGDEHPAKPESSKGRIYNILLGEKSDAGATDSTGASASVGAMPVVDCGDQFLPGETPDPEGRLFNDALTVVDDAADVNLIGGSPAGTITYPTRVFVAPIIGGEIGPFSNVPTGFLDDNGDGMGGHSFAHAHRKVWMDIAGGADEYLTVFTKVPGFHPQTNPTVDLNARYKIVSGTPSMPAWPPRNGGVGPQWDFFEDFLDDTDGSQWGVLSISAPLNLNYTITGTPGTTRYVYAVSALATLGESPRSAVLEVLDGPAVLNGTDNIVLTWDPPADNADAVIAYRIRGRQTNPPTKYLRITEVGVSPIPETYTDDGTDAEKAFNVSSGDALVSENVWAWIACALGEVDIHEVYGSDGAEGDTPKRRLIGWDEGTILGPDSIGWPEAERYRVVGGIRQSGFYARGLPLKHHREGAVTFAWNGCGWKDDDDLLVDQVFRQLLLFVNEVVEKNNGEGYRDGAFGPIETFANGDPKFLTSKFEAAQQQTVEWLTPGSPAALGYVGTIIVTEPTALSEILRRFFHDYGGHGTTNHRGQWYPFLPNPEPEAGAGRLYAERREIARLVDHRYAKDEQENRVVYSYDYNYDTQEFRNKNITVEDSASIAAHGGERIGVFQDGERQCYYANDQTTIEDRWQRHLTLYAYAPRYVQWATNLKSLADHNGDPARFSHRKEGLGLNGEAGTPGVILHTIEKFSPGEPREVIQTAMLFRT
jgi:hypothetical protein